MNESHKYNLIYFHIPKCAGVSVRRAIGIDKSTHPFPHKNVSTALAIDYDGLIIPAGKRHIDALANEAHAKRVLRAFLREDMPVLLQGDASAMLQLVDGATDRPHSTADDSRGAAVVDGRLITTAAAHDDLAELEAFDEAVGSVVDESCAA